MTDALSTFQDGLKTALAEQHQELREAIQGLDAGALNWTPGPETNSIAVLVAHSMGAEHSLISTALGEPVDRDREAEFRTQAGNLEELTAIIDRVDKAVPGLIDRLTSEDLAAERSRPNDRLGRTKPGIWWLLHAAEHNREHMGQILLTRQMYEQRGAGER